MHAGEDLEITLPAYGTYLPDTDATVTVSGRTMCRTPDDATGRFRVNGGARLIARGSARAVVEDSSIDAYDKVTADLTGASTACLYSPEASVHAGPGSTVYAWAGTVHAQAGSQVWVMGDRVTVNAAAGAAVGDGEDSPLRRQAPIDGDAFARHRLNGEMDIYDREPLYTAGRW